ncbi:MAG TPA: hypothetical protein VJS30_06300 [Paraburkholderia sp.]|nr:hypothetical protein [Paraburkholderia sp.]
MAEGGAARAIVRTEARIGRSDETRKFCTLGYINLLDSPAPYVRDACAMQEEGVVKLRMGRTAERLRRID